MTDMTGGLRNYLVVTGAYWGFTITDGALRMLVVLYFHNLGYSPLQIAFLFLFYEFFGVVTNLVGGWVGSRIGLNLTMHLGMGLQVLALGMLTVPDAWLTVPYVMLAQALSGIAKDLNKMSAKASVKLMVPKEADARLFKWVAVLTGSKNSLKGAGFFLGGALLALVGFRMALVMLAGGLFLVLVVTVLLLPKALGKSKAKAKFTQIFSKTREINWLSAARFFLFGSRDIWFVVGLPVFLASVLGWGHAEVGGFLALWVIGYGAVQASAPRLLKKSHHARGPDGGTARLWVFVLALFPAGIAVALMQGWDPALSIIIGLAAFGIVFAINSAVHSYLILAYSDHDKVAINQTAFLYPDMGCSVIYAADQEVVLDDNNEDYSNPFTMAWFLPPEEGKFGWVYFGYENFIPFIYIFFMISKILWFSNWMKNSQREIMLSSYRIYSPGISLTWIGSNQRRTKSKKSEPHTRNLRGIQEIMIRSLGNLSPSRDEHPLSLLHNRD